jgi:hypothetical protein
MVPRDQRIVGGAVRKDAGGFSLRRRRSCRRENTAARVPRPEQEIVSNAESVVNKARRVSD